MYSPLGRDGDAASYEGTKQHYTIEVKLPKSRTVVSDPVWAGILLDCREDPAACYLLFLCTFCVFGWNMERLGFGNMYVHTAMYLLLCVAPFWVFIIMALNIHDRRRRGDRPVLLRATVRWVLEDPDEEEVRAAREQVVLWVGVADGLRTVAALLTVRACAGGAHGEPVRRGGRQLLRKTDGRW